MTESKEIGQLTASEGPGWRSSRKSCPHTAAGRSPGRSWWSRGYTGRGHWEWHRYGPAGSHTCRRRPSLLLRRGMWVRVFTLSLDVFLVGFLIVARVHGITERGEFFRNQHIPKYTTLAIFEIKLGSSLHSYAIHYFYNGQVGEYLEIRRACTSPFGLRCGSCSDST